MEGAKNDPGAGAKIVFAIPDILYIPSVSFSDSLCRLFR